MTQPKKVSKYPRGTFKKKDRFVALISRGGVRHYLGTFDTPEEAGAAYTVAEAKKKGEIEAAEIELRLLKFQRKTGFPDLTTIWPAPRIQQSYDYSNPKSTTTWFNESHN